MFHLYSISDQFVYWKLSPDPNLDSKRKFNFSVKALNLLANSPSPTHSKTPCQIPLVSASSSNWTLSGFPSANSIGIEQHLHFCTAASTWHFSVQQTLTDEQENEKKKKAFLEITSNVLFMQLWLPVGLARLLLEGKTLPACNVLLHALSKQATTPEFFPPHLLNW